MNTNPNFVIYLILDRALTTLSHVSRASSDQSKTLQSFLSDCLPEEIGEYLSFRSFQEFIASGKENIVDKSDLYVAMDDVNNESFSCACLFGSEVINPPMRISTIDQFREMWEYLRRCMDVTAMCDFESFLERKVCDALEAFESYKVMLKQEIVPIEYVLLSSHGLAIYSTLYSDTRERLMELHAIDQLYQQTKAPPFMIQGNMEYAKSALEMFRILQDLKSRVRV